MNMQQSNSRFTKQIPEIIRRNVKQVIQTLMSKGFQYEETLINQYLNGEKTQFQFLLPKSKYYRYYTEQLTDQMSKQTQRQRKVPSLQEDQMQNQINPAELTVQMQRNLLIIGTVEDVSVGAMCELIKQLKQNKQSYEPFENEVYQQQLMINLQDQNLTKKISPIFQMISQIKNPLKSKEGVKCSPERQTAVKMELLRSELGTQKDGSMGGWGGKKYQGLGKRDQFANYRKQFSKNFYQSSIR